MKKLILLFLSLCICPDISCAEDIKDDIKIDVDEELSAYKLAMRIQAGATLEEIRRLATEENVNPQAVDGDAGVPYITPLLAAVRRGDPEIVRFLTSKGAQVLQPVGIETAETALHTCVREAGKNAVEITRILLEFSGEETGRTEENSSGETIKDIARNSPNAELKKVCGIRVKPPKINKSKSTGKPKNNTEPEITAEQEGYASWIFKRVIFTAFAVLALNEFSKKLESGDADEDEEVADQKK